MFSKKILCGVVAYTTLASVSVGAYDAGGIEYKNIPSVIVNNPLLSAGVLTAITTAILTYKILAKSYGEEFLLENPKNEKIKENLHEDLPAPKNSSEVKEPGKDSGEVKSEPTNGSKENGNNLDGFNLDFFRNKIEKWHVYTGIAVIATAVIVLIISKISSYLFWKVKEHWQNCCEELEKVEVEIGNLTLKGSTVFVCAVAIGDKSFYYVPDFEIKSHGKEISVVPGTLPDGLFFNYLKQINYMNAVKDGIKKLAESDRKGFIFSGKNEHTKDVLFIGLENYANANYEEYHIEKGENGNKKDSPKEIFNKAVGAWKKSCKLLKNTTFKHEENVLDGVKVFKAVLDLEKDEHPGTQKFVIGKNIADRRCKEIYLKDKDVYFLIGNEEKKLNLNELYDFCYKIETLAMCILHEPKNLLSLEIYDHLYDILVDKRNYFERKKINLEESISSDNSND